MEKAFMNEPAQQSGQPKTLTSDRIVAIVWRSAVDAFVKSILVIVMGSVALGLAGGIWRVMTPAAPPGFVGKPAVEAPLPTAWRTWSASLDQHRLLIVFGLIFVPTLWFRLTRRDGEEQPPEGASRLEKMGKHVSERWFGFIVGNAFGALVAAMVVTWVQQFSLTKMLFGWLLDSVSAAVQDGVQHLLGARQGDAFRAWSSWYHANQLKFTFWFLYLAAICDDLGIPNLKTLSAKLWPQLRKRMKK